MIKNLEISALKLKKAILENKSIVLLSDADLDGVASLIVLEESIGSLGGGNLVIKYFPNRDKDGYGLNNFALKKIKKYAPGILILSDCGISSYLEIDKAMEMGFEVIIIDHHEVLNALLPKTPYVIDPKQEGDEYPFKLMAACGLCFKFAQELLGEKMSSQLRSSFLELVALGTIADMMPEKDDNKDFIEKGLTLLMSSQRPGIVALKDLFGNMISNKEFAQKIISVLQVTDFSSDNLIESYLLLCANCPNEAKKLAQIIFKKSEKRRKLMMDSVLEISKNIELGSPFVFFVAKSGAIPGSLAGGIASRICNQFKKPAFIIICGKGLCRGSTRSTKPVNVVDALNDCGDLLITYGGHPQAAGFSLDEKNLDIFKNSLSKHFSDNNQ